MTTSATTNAAAIAAALAQMIDSALEDDVEAELHNLEAKELVKDFTKSDGPTHYSGEGEDRIKRWIDPSPIFCISSQPGAPKTEA